MAEMRETFEKVRLHDETIRKHEDTIHGEILPRLREVERLQEEVTKEMTAMRQSQTSLELTVMKENQTTRQQVEKLEATLTKQSENLFEIVKTSLGIQSTRNSQVHEFKMAKWNHIATILIKFGGGITLLLGSGTGIVMIIEHYFGK